MGKMRKIILGCVIVSCVLFLIFMGYWWFRGIVWLELEMAGGEVGETLERLEFTIAVDGYARNLDIDSVIFRDMEDGGVIYWNIAGDYDTVSTEVSVCYGVVPDRFHEEMTAKEIPNNTMVEVSVYFVGDMPIPSGDQKWFYFYRDKDGKFIPVEENRIKRFLESREKSVGMEEIEH